MARKKFEEALAELEAIVQRLENPDVPLEEAVALFEDGIKLSRLCSEKLDEAEKRVDLLLQNERGVSTVCPFSEDEPE